MTLTKTRYDIEGKFWIPIFRAATLLGTNAASVRKLMADCTLEWRQFRMNSKSFLVREDQVLSLRLDRLNAKYSVRGSGLPTQS